MNQTYTIPEEEMERARFFALRYARRLQRQLDWFFDVDVLENEAELAVWRAAQTYDPDRGAAFLSWATRQFRIALIEELRRQSPWTRNQRDKIQARIAAGGELEGWMHAPLPLDTGVVLADDLSLEDVLEDATQPQNFNQADLRSMLEPALRCVPIREREIIHRFYFEGQPLLDIAASMGINPGYIDHLKRKGMDRLRAAFPQ